MIKLLIVLLLIIISPLVIFCSFAAMALIGSILFLIGLLISNAVIVIVNYINEWIGE